MLSIKRFNQLQLVIKCIYLAFFSTASCLSLKAITMTKDTHSTVVWFILEHTPDNRNKNMVTLIYQLQFVTIFPGEISSCHPQGSLPPSSSPTSYFNIDCHRGNSQISTIVAGDEDEDYNNMDQKNEYFKNWHFPTKQCVHLHVRCFRTPEGAESLEDSSRKKRKWNNPLRSNWVWNFLETSLSILSFNYCSSLYN